MGDELPSSSEVVQNARMLTVDLRAIDEVAKRRGVEAAAVVLELKGALAATAHFGPQHVFECALEDDALRVSVAIRLKAKPVAPGEVALEKALALGMEVVEDDELLFEVALGDEGLAQANDREHGALYGFKTLGSGFTAVAKQAMRKMVPLDNPMEALDDALRLALTLALLPPGARETPAAWSLYRLSAESWGRLQLRRRYELGAAGALGMTRQEAVTLLNREDLPDGAAVELFVDSVSLHELLLGLLDPGVLSRVAAQTGFSQEDLVQGLKSVGIDLQAREIERRSWVALPIDKQKGWQPLVIVEKASKDDGELSLANARLLDPAVKLGAKLEFPTISADTFPDVLKLFTGRDTCRFDHTMMAADFERQRGLALGVPVPAALAAFFSKPLMTLFPEDHGVLVAETDGKSAEALWRRLDAAASKTGYRPVILGGDERELTEARSAWQQDLPVTTPGVMGLQSGSHKMTDPASVLAEAADVDVEDLLAKNPSSSEFALSAGEWPAKAPSVRLSALQDPLTHKPMKRVWMALVPTDAAWKALAYLPLLTQAGEAVPSLAQAVAVAKKWEKRFGAKIAVVRPATLEWIVERPPEDREAALLLAQAHGNFTPEGGAEILEKRAAELMARVWYAWWD